MSRENKYLLDINIDEKNYKYNIVNGKYFNCDEIVNNDKELDNVEGIEDFNNLVAITIV